jgi:3-deoxy-manno-octulosonate cytidylyltransferase (CMP-KDO synthetase)
MTRADRASGTDRIAEVAAQFDWDDDAVVVNVQGDVPLLTPASIDQVATLLATHDDAAMATLCTPITDAAEYWDPHIVEVVFDQSGRALHFSRARIPAAGHGHDELPSAYRHVGIYAYRVSALRNLTATPPCRLEQTERLPAAPCDVAGHGDPGRRRGAQSGSVHRYAARPASHRAIQLRLAGDFSLPNAPGLRERASVRPGRPSSPR